MDKIILAVLIVLAFYLIGRWIRKNTYHDPPNGTFYDHDKIHSNPQKDISEFSLENLDLDKMLKVINLRKKLKKIEKERDLINHDPDEN